MEIPNKIYDPVDVDQEYFIDHETEREEFYTKAMAMPGSIIGILFDTETSVKIKGVSESLQLNQRQSEELSRLIRKILVAEVYLGNIVSEITGKLSVGQDTAKNIANRLLTELFAPALEDIKKLHIEKFGGAPKAEERPKPDQNINPVSGLARDKIASPKNLGKATINGINPNNVLNLRKQ